MSNDPTTNREPDISIVIVSWNTRALLHRCLTSIQAESQRAGLRVETMVVDNASEDNTVESVRTSFPDVSVMALERNLGFAAANNQGIARSTGRAVLLLNPDTEILPDALSILWRTLSMAPHVGMVGPLLLNPDYSLQSAGYRFPGLTQVFLDFFPLHPRLMGSTINGRISPGDGRSPVEIDHPLGACMLVRREAIEQVGAFDESYFMYSEEVDWCRRLRQAGWTILTAPAAHVVHYGGQSTSQVRQEMLIHLHQSRARYYRRYESRRFLRAVQVMSAAAAWWAMCVAHQRPHDPAIAERATALEAVALAYRTTEQVNA